MSEEILGMVFFVSFFGMISYITRVLSDNRVRREVLKVDANSDYIRALMADGGRTDPKSSLKWGMVTIALGGALALIHVLGLDGDQALTWGLLALFGGGALIGFYLIADKDESAGLE